MNAKFGSELLGGCQNGRYGQTHVLLQLLTLLMLLQNLVTSAPIQLHGVAMDGASSKKPEPFGNPEEEMPVFEPTSANVSALEGQTVYLPCRVRNLRDRRVSWIRSRDLHILTSGDVAFSSDARFASNHAAGSDAWTLRLDNAKRTDSGLYECQVNTEPKIMYAVQLAVRDPDKSDGNDEPHSQQTRISYESTAPLATIMGPREQRVPSSSTVTLRCIITSPYQPRPVRGVQWLRDNRLLTFQAARGGISVETEKGATQTVSELTVAGVTQNDGGRYSCRPSDGRMDTVTLIVEEEERSEAMQRDASYVSSGCDVKKWSAMVVTWLFLLCTHI